ncbi:MAG: acetate--CoA ligase family protein [Clostridia bacterium]|nr:acetate--CoA ligase family protein [Clostridia bacterium]
MQFAEATMKNINQVFLSAYEDGRKALYEHEVYQVLHHIGLEVPKFVFAENPYDVSSKMLENFGEEIVVKIVSPQIAHKQKLGGVKIIRNYDPMFVQFVLARMKDEVLSHFEEGNKPEITGFLLVEFLPHTQAIGYEVLIGFKEDPAFGPVLTLSKGGDDAEFFAKYYDAANLFLPPMDYEAALKMVNTLNIRHKFKQIGHTEYMEYMAKAMSVLSGLAYHYSFVAEKKPEFIIKAIDINPFVITKDNRFVAIDGFAEFIKTSEESKSVPEVNTNHLEGFFRPKGIAVVGVSADMDKYSLGREIGRLLHDLNRDDLYFINARGGALRFDNKEYVLYKSLDEIEDNIDLVVYAAPAQYTIDFIKSLKAGKPKAVILISGIPANIKYSEFAKQLDEFIPDGLRIIGPNCMGVYFAPDQSGKGLNTLFIEEKRLELKHSSYSNTVLLTQSGALAVTAIDKLQNTRIFKSVVSFGNKYDVKITDLMAYFAKEDSIDLISLYIEGLDAGEGRQFFQLARKISKPIIAYKSGKTEAGAKAAASHTASMSGSYDVFKAACLQAGVILIENIDDHYNFVKVFSLLAHKIPSGNRVAGVVNAGFESTVGADELKNLRQAQLSTETIEKLNTINKYGLVDTSSPFLDITPMADDRMYADFVEAVLQDENVDCVFVAIVPHATTLKTTPDTCRDQDSLANLLVELGKKHNKPMVVSVNAGRYYQDFVSIMESNGLPVFNDIRSSIKSLDTFVSYHFQSE